MEGKESLIPARDPRYFVDPAKRIKEILGDEPIPETAHLTYSFTEGYERLEYRSSPENGGLHFAGSYHPEAMCVGRGICTFCGRTLFDE